VSDAFQKLQNTFTYGSYWLTKRDFSNYIRVMDAELRALEDRLGQLIELAQRLRGDNRELRQQLAHAANENKRLRETADAAKARLAALLDHIPENR